MRGEWGRFVAFLGVGAQNIMRLQCLNPFRLLKNMFSISPAGFKGNISPLGLKGNLSLLYFLIFFSPGVLTKWKTHIPRGGVLIMPGMGQSCPWMQGHAAPISAGSVSLLLWGVGEGVESSLGLINPFEAKHMC